LAARAPSTLSVRIKQAEAAQAQPAVLAAEAEPAEVLRGALNATKANGQPDWRIRLTAARALAALAPKHDEPEPLSESDCATIVYDLPPGSSPILHRPPPSHLAAANEHEPAQPLPEPGTYFFQPPRGRMVLLVRHATDESSEAHILDNYEAAAEILRAVGGDRRVLGTHPDAQGVLRGHPLIPDPNAPVLFTEADLA